MRNIFSRSFQLLLAAFAFICTTAVAHTQEGDQSVRRVYYTQAQQDPVTIIENRAANVVESVMRIRADRANRLEAEKTLVNQLRPLDADKLDSSNIQVSKRGLTAFLDYLGRYRDSSEVVLHKLEDSVAILRSDMPKLYRETFMSRFLTAYTADMNAFDQYTLAVSELYKEVIAMLSFIDNSQHQLKKGKLVFADAKTEKTYQKNMKALTKRSADLKKAAQASNQTENSLHEATDHLFEKPSE
jgi:hypothetical protein